MSEVEKNGNNNVPFTMDDIIKLIKACRRLGVNNIECFGISFSFGDQIQVRHSKPLDPVVIKDDMEKDLTQSKHDEVAEATVMAMIEDPELWEEQILNQQTEAMPK